MPVVIHDEEILVKCGDASFYFSPITLADLFQLGVGQDALPDKKRAIQEFLAVLPTKLVRWENVVDSQGNPIECSPQNFQRLPALVAMNIINKFAEASGLTEDFEKNLEERSNKSAI